MASPFTLEEKQVLLEAKSLDNRKNRISEILKTYNFDHLRIILQSNKNQIIIPLSANLEKILFTNLFSPKSLTD